MYDEYNNDNTGSGTEPENSFGSENYSENTGSEGPSSGGSFSDGSYSFNKEDLYEAEYVAEDDASAKDEANRYYDSASAGESYTGGGAFSEGPSAGGYEEPRWEPNPGKYNSAPSYDTAYTSAGTPPQQKKKKKKWWIIPLVVVLVLMVAFIAVGVWYGFKYVDSYITASDSGEESTTDDSTELNIVDSSSSTSSGIVLTDVSAIVEEVMPAVVSITSRTLVNNSSNFWGYSFGGSSDSSTTEVESGIGSGTIVGTNDTELLILTSYHVVEDSSSLYVTFCDDESVDGYIKSASEDYDIAVVAVPLEDMSDSTLEAITIATICTEQASVGEGVVVIGDALGYGQSVTTGIVSAVDREITVDDMTITVLQTDAAINSGNSGGCMLNSAGEIIGISEAKISSDNVEGMCYAISVNVYADLIEELLTTTTTTGSGTSSAEESTSSGSSSSSSEQTAYLGIQGVEVDSDTASTYNMVEGVYVASVVSGGGAEAAGVQEGDIIVALDGTEVTTMSGLQSLLAGYSAGDTVTLTIMRSSGSGYSSITLQVTLTGSLS